MNRISLYFTGKRQVSINEEELPKTGDGGVLVQTLFSAISPGTESLIYRGEFPTGMQADENIPSLSAKFAYPFKYGYSAVGKGIVGHRCGFEIERPFGICLSATRKPPL